MPDDLEADAVFGRRLGRGLAGVALVDEGEFDGLGGDLLDGHGQVRHLGAVAFIGGRDVQRQQMAEGVHHRMRLRAAAALGAVPARPVSALGRGLQRAAIDHHGGRLGPAALLQA